MTKKLKPLHPGVFLKEDFMDHKKYNLSIKDLAKKIFVSKSRIYRIVNGKGRITPDTAIRLEKLFEVSYDFWLNLQRDYDKRIGKKKDDHIPEIISLYWKD